MEFGFKQPSVFFEEKKFEILDLSDLGQMWMNYLDLGFS